MAWAQSSDFPRNFPCSAWRALAKVPLNIAMKPINLILLASWIAAALLPSTHGQGVTKQEQAEGWKSIFNGSDLSGWANRGKTSVSNWAAEDGVLTLKQPGGDDIVYVAEQFEDFELSIDWKSEGNSGVFVRMSSQEDWLNTGMEIQVLRRAGTGKHATGALYDLVAPPSEAKVRENDWNNFHIICDGPIVSCKMNGVQTFRIDLRDEKWKVPQGKFKLPYATLPRKGWIMLQDHGAAVAYRNIKVKPLR